MPLIIESECSTINLEGGGHIPAQRIFLVTADLNARVRVEGAAPEGAQIMVRPTLGSLAEADLVILDLDQGGAELIEEAVRLGTGGSGVRWVGFFSHIDDELGTKAEAAGIEAIPRGRFWRELTDLFA